MILPSRINCSIACQISSQGGITSSSIVRCVRLYRLCSEASPSRLREAAVHCAVAISQPAKLLLPALRHFGVGLIPWSPIGMGLLGGVR